MSARLDSDPGRWDDKYADHDEPQPPCSFNYCDEESLEGELYCRKHAIQNAERRLEALLAKHDPDDNIPEATLRQRHPEIDAVFVELHQLERRRFG